MMKKNSLLLLLLSICYVSSHAQSPFASFNHWITNGSSTSVLNDSTSIFLGGTFTYVGPPASYGAKMTNTSTDPDLNYCRPNAVVNCVIPDGSGGWFIGGNFSSIDIDSATTVARNHIAHILPSGALDMTWNPDADTAVYALALSGGDLYAGGVFTSIGGQPRNFIAKLSTTGTGLADATWNPASTNIVRTLLVSGPDLYVGGKFDNIGGLPRNRIAKLSTTGTGAADATWDPNASNEVQAMVLNGNDLYAGGNFTTIGGLPKNRMARISTTGTGLVDTLWDPNSGGTIYALALDGGDLYAGGTFTTMGGFTKRNLARVSASGIGQVDSVWDPNPLGPLFTIIYDIALNGNDVFAGGLISSIGGQNRVGLAKVSKTGTGLADSLWNPISVASIYPVIYAISFDGNNLYTGGEYYSIGGQYRNNLAKLDASGVLDMTWNPNPDGSVNSMAVNGNSFFVSGAFTSIGGQSKNFIAKLSATGTGDANALWNPIVSAAVSTISLNTSFLYVGGQFDSINGSYRSRIARLDTTGTGIIDPSWDPSVQALVPTETVSTMAFNGTDVFAAGNFTSIGGLARKYIAKISIATGVVDPTWDPSANNTIRTVMLNNDQLYVGGTFDSIGGLDRRRMARLSTSGTGQADAAWTATANNTVSAFAFSGTDVFVAGSFDSIGGTNRNRIAKLSTGSGAVDTWNPNANSAVTSLSLRGNSLYAGGGFRLINGIGRYRVARFDLSVIVPQQIADQNILVNNLAIVYPNPAGDILSIKLTDNRKINMVSVYNLSGSLVKQEKYVNGIHVSNLSRGVYVMDISTDKGILHTKFLKD